MPRVAIVGGGLIGLFSAFYLQQQGMEVTVLEKGDIGGGAARRNGGWVCPNRAKPLPSRSEVLLGLKSLGDSQAPLRAQTGFLLRNSRFFLGFASATRASKVARGEYSMSQANRETLELFAGLQEKANVEGPVGNGFITVFGDRHRAEQAREGVKKRASNGLAGEPEEVIGHEDLCALEPGLDTAAQWGFRTTGDKWVDPDRFVTDLAAYLESAGVEIRVHTPVENVRQEGSQVIVETSAGAERYDQCIIAAGVWSRELVKPLGYQIPLLKGQGYSFEAPVANEFSHTIVLGDSHLGITPTSVGLKVVGLIDFTDDSEEFRDERIEMMIKNAQPFLRDVDWVARVHEWSASRPMTPDGLPIVGRLRGKHNRIVLATGHNMLGLTLGPSTGSLLSRIVERGPESKQTGPAAWDPARF